MAPPAAVETATRSSPSGQRTAGDTEGGGGGQSWASSRHGEEACTVKQRRETLSGVGFPVPAVEPEGRGDGGGGGGRVTETSCGADDIYQSSVKRDVCRADIPRRAKVRRK